MSDPTLSSPEFKDLSACWICGSQLLRRVFEGRMDLSIYREQDPELAEYTGMNVPFNRCAGCGFSQPSALPALPRFFDRMYDQRWSDEWIEREFTAGYKDRIFLQVLKRLSRRTPEGRRSLLDVGAHVGRLIHLATQQGWDAEGIELNPRTAEFAARRTGRPVHRRNAHELAQTGRDYDAVTLIDVLEHIPDPLRLLRQATALIKPGGWIGIKVPNGRAQAIKERIRARVQPGYRPTLADNLVHVNHFSPGSLRLALEKAGCESIVLEAALPEAPPDAPGFAGWIRGRLAPQNLVNAAARTIPGALHSPAALHLQACARRPA